MTLILTSTTFENGGDIPARDHQTVFEERALGRFKRQDARIAVQPEQRFSTPLRVTERYAFDEEIRQFIVAYQTAPRHQ